MVIELNGNRPLLYGQFRWPLTPMALDSMAFRETPSRCSRTIENDALALSYSVNNETLNENKKATYGNCRRKLWNFSRIASFILFHASALANLFSYSRHQAPDKGRHFYLGKLLPLWLSRVVERLVAAVTASVTNFHFVSSFPIHAYPVR